MKIIILAAGKSPRMLPLTKDTPKCMLEVGEKSILETQLNNLKSAGISGDEIIIITGYLPEKIEPFCKSLGVKTLFNPFYEVSGMSLTLWVAKEELKEGFILIYSDVLFDSGIIEELLQTEEEICLAIEKDGVREEAEKVVEEEGTIKNISKTRIEGENGEFIGIAKFSSKGAKRLIKELDLTARTNLKASLIEVIDNMIKKEEIVTALDVKDAQFIDIDFPEDLEKAREIFG